MIENEMSAAEMSRVRLECFDRLKGWGTTVGDKFAEWGFDERMKKASVLAEWSLGRPEYSYCSFCGKHSDTVKYMIAGRTAFICDECISMCFGTIAEKLNTPKEE